MNKVKLAFLAVGVLLAMVFTFSCSSEGTEGVENGDVDIDTKGKTVDELLADGIESLKAEKWDEAVAYYDAAYAKDNNDTKAVVYSVLANLAKISIDPKVVDLIKNNLGFTEYPNKLNALFSDDWMKKYPDYEYDYGIYDSVFLPAIKTPDWVKGEGSVYNDALLSGNIFGSEAWAISLLANLLDRNASGVNNTLDEVIDGVFGVSFNEAVNRLKKLENKKEDRISLDHYFIDKLGLEDVFDEYDKIGWAEVNAVVSATLMVKASLEWLQTYDLNTDLNWLKHSWKDEDTFIAKFNSVSSQNLPFNNSFLKPRSEKSMDNVKTSYVKAIQGLQESYKSIISSELYPTKVKDSHTTINGGFDKLIAAINGGGKFYIPKDPTKGQWPATKTDDVVSTVDFGKFFTAGYFSLENLFETNGGKPVFYRGYEVAISVEREYCYYDCREEPVFDDDDNLIDFEYVCGNICHPYTYYDYDYNYEVLSKSDYSAKLDRGSDLCLKLDISHIKQVVDGVDLKFSSSDSGGEAAPSYSSGSSASLNAPRLKKEVVGDEYEYVHILPGGELAKTVFGKYYP